MRKLQFLLIISFIIFSGFSDNQIWIKAKMPVSVNAGDKFTIEFIVNKRDLQHFAELKQSLPKGFKAVEKQSGSAQFSFKDQIVKFTWVRLPRDHQFIISYDVIVDKNVNGNYTLPAQFTYIYNNLRGNAQLENDNILVLTKGVQDNNLNSTAETIFFPPKEPDQVQCIRISPIYIKESKAFIVKLLLSTGNINTSAKIREKIPANYIVELIEGRNAKWIFENNKLELIWKKMPDVRNFEVSYKLFPNKAHSALPVIIGSFDYLIDGSFQTYAIKEIEQNKINKPVLQDFDKTEVMNFFK